MDKISRRKLIDMFISFFESKDHKKIESSSLVPVNDATVLFTSAGMHPLVPYLLGEHHPNGRRLVGLQHCIRTGDIDEVGDDSHCTFFEMLGNWSLGDYFKNEAIEYSFEFLTSKKYLGFDINSLAVTCFAGDETAPRDQESADKWESLGIKKENIFFLGKKHNWWGLAAGTGPCGPDTEMFFDTGKPKCSKECSPACDCGKYIEIWNDVFMQYKIDNAGDKPEPLKNKNVDTGLGVERIICTINGHKSVYDTEMFAPVIKYIGSVCKFEYEQTYEITKAYRVIAEHLRTAAMILGDTDVVPSNVGRGYVLRRLIRRAINFARKLELSDENLVEIALIYVDYFKDDYPGLINKKQTVINELNKEIRKFQNTINLGLKEFNKALSAGENKVLSGEVAFRLYDTFGFPIELTQEMSKENGFTVDMAEYENAYRQHQEKSRTANAGTFKGGLADTSYDTTKLHTAAHLMLAGLRKVLGSGVHQKGSNITNERLRFDFSFDRKLTDDEVLKVEDFVNDAIKSAIDVDCTEMNVADAFKSGALGEFGAKYNDIVKVYSIKDISKEICGGPHVKNTYELGTFKITKQEASSAGVRRIKAVLI